MSHESLRLLTLAESDGVARLVKGSLEGAGAPEASVDFKSEAWEALAALAGGGYGAAVVDCRGVEPDALRLMQVAPEKGVDVPFIFLVSSSEGEFVERARALGVAECLTEDEVASAAFRRLVTCIVDRYNLAANAKSEAAAPWFDRYTTPLAILLVLFTGIASGVV